MNAVEIEQAITELAERPFDATEFPFAFLEAFGNKPTTLKRLRTSAANKSDVGGVLQTNHIHILAAEPGGTAAALACLQESPATHNRRLKVRFLLATDGATFEAVDQETGETVACNYADFPDHFGFFLPLAGISTVKAIRENAFDVRATSRLNRLYLKLLEENPDWGTAARRHDLNHFFARLIFCFFAEDTDILAGDGLFTATVEQMADDTNTAHVISEIFRSMNTAIPKRDASGLPRWANAFPYVNGGLFSGSVEVPAFSRLARRYLIHIGHLDWKRINPDIFGSMIQAVADDEERGALGMHYTSVPNILKVLNPLFLDDLRAKLEEAGDNSRKLLNLRKRMARIRVFDPACGSGNFLVIAYKEVRAIEAEVNRRRGEEGEASAIPLTNFRGIEIRDFSAEIARLALIIAEYQCDVLYRGQKDALAEFLPLDAENWITCGNALRIDWLAICPPTGTGVRVTGDDLFATPLDQSEIAFENEGGETYICGNPPYKGRNKKGSKEKEDAKQVFEKYGESFASLDYVCGWLVKAAEFSQSTPTKIGFVATNSICQGEQVAMLWPLIFGLQLRISFAYTSFKWTNLASDKAGVTVIVIGLDRVIGTPSLYIDDEVRIVEGIGPYLVPNSETIVKKFSMPISNIGMMHLGNMPKDGGNLLLSKSEAAELHNIHGVNSSFIRPFYGADELINAQPRACIWIEDGSHSEAKKNGKLLEIFDRVSKFRSESTALSTAKMAHKPYRFVQIAPVSGKKAIIVPRVSSENRPYLPVDYLDTAPIIGDKCFALHDEPVWNLALLVSRLHLIWIATVCSRLESRFSYGNTLGWNTFPVPPLTQKNRDDLTACAEAILLTREAHFPATIAGLYDPERMPDDLHAAHDANDETLERIYIGRRFRNDTERLEYLFKLYTEITTKEAS